MLEKEAFFGVSTVTGTWNFLLQSIMCPDRNGEQRIMEVLRLVGLENSAFQLYQKYSGGMKRKLALARTLLPDPPIIMLDEPTTGLDAISSRNIQGLR